jgi:quercetin dioxygenase-like cupin family protein
MSASAITKNEGQRQADLEQRLQAAPSFRAFHENRAGANYLVFGGEYAMRQIFVLAWALAASLVSGSVSAQDAATAKPDLILRGVVGGMPRSDKQEVRLLSATINPGERTPYHTHRFPVTVYVLEGAFTLEMEGRAPVIVKAGEGMTEPPNVPMTGYNRESEPLKVIIFYVSDPDTPFLDPVAH